MNDFRKSKSFYRPLIIADKTQFLFFIDHFDFMLFTGMSLPFSLKTPSFILYKSCLSLTSTIYLLLFVEFQFIFLWGVLVLLILVPPPPLLLMFSFCYKFWSLLGICLILKNLFSRNVTFSKEKKPSLYAPVYCLSRYYYWKDASVISAFVCLLEYL